MSAAMPSLLVTTVKCDIPAGCKLTGERDTLGRLVNETMGKAMEKDGRRHPAFFLPVLKRLAVRVGGRQAGPR